MSKTKYSFLAVGLLTVMFITYQNCAPVAKSISQTPMTDFGFTDDPPTSFQIATADNGRPTTSPTRIECTIEDGNFRCSSRFIFTGTVSGLVGDQIYRFRVNSTGQEYGCVGNGEFSISTRDVRPPPAGDSRYSFVGLEPISLDLEKAETCTGPAIAVLEDAVVLQGKCVDDKTPVTINGRLSCPLPQTTAPQTEAHFGDAPITSANGTSGVCTLSGPPISITRIAPTRGLQVYVENLTDPILSTTHGCVTSSTTPLTINLSYRGSVRLHLEEVVNCTNRMPTRRIDTRPIAAGTSFTCQSPVSSPSATPSPSSSPTTLATPSATPSPTSSPTQGTGVLNVSFSSVISNYNVNSNNCTVTGRASITGNVPANYTLCVAGLPVPTGIPHFDFAPALAIPPCGTGPLSCPYGVFAKLHPGNDCTAPNSTTVSSVPFRCDPTYTFNAASAISPSNPSKCIAKLGVSNLPGGRSVCITVDGSSKGAFGNTTPQIVPLPDASVTIPNYEFTGSKIIVATEVQGSVCANATALSPAKTKQINCQPYLPTVSFTSPSKCTLATNSTFCRSYDLRGIASALPAGSGLKIMAGDNVFGCIGNRPDSASAFGPYTTTPSGAQTSWIGTNNPVTFKVYYVSDVSNTQTCTGANTVLLPAQLRVTACLPGESANGSTCSSAAQ